jgi:hypothetical protein
MDQLEQDHFLSSLGGGNGPLEQLRAFRESWAQGALYIRALRQSVIGCGQLCKDDDLRSELAALALAAQDIVAYFDRFGDGIWSLEADIADTHDPKSLN